MWRHFSSTTKSQNTSSEVGVSRLARWDKWLKHAAADVILEQDAAQLAGGRRSRGDR